MDPLHFRNVTENNESEIIRAGDRLQSEASRMAEWILQVGLAPYEVHMAALEARSAVERWTNARINR